MNKKQILPKLAVTNIWKNSSTYLPYIGVCIFAVFTYFVFDLILHNDVVKTVPRAAYAMALLQIGFILLGIIMVPFLYYTNSFLIKRRKKELGLYSILGMEKKHIGIMMLMESVVIYLIVVTAAILMGLLFSRLLFLLLLNLAHLSVEAEFSFSWDAVKNTVLFFGLITVLNLAVNLMQVGRANPIELMSDSRKGEKEPKMIWIWTILGMITLGWGYYLAIKAKVDSMIFTNFFFAVFLVVVGTYFLFTSGSIYLLRCMKKNKKYYYRPDNFITVSGMLYRMKKSAASLVNICIFATMVIITVLCTTSVYLGAGAMMKFMFPYQMEIHFMDRDFVQKDAWSDELTKLADDNGVEIVDFLECSYVNVHVVKNGDSFTSSADPRGIQFEDSYSMRLLTLEAFNKMEGVSETLDSGQVFVYTGGKDYGQNQINLAGSAYQVAKELKECAVEPKASDNAMGGDYTVVLPDLKSVTEVAAAFGVDAASEGIFRSGLNFKGSEEAGAEFMKEVYELSAGTEGFARFVNNVEAEQESTSMYGGLLFIGIFFGLIFLICLLIIMYYKQITEGFEDQNSFEIMQKVGMSDIEVRRTIKKQILMVFFLPLIGAFLHTGAAINMIIKLMATLNMFNAGLVAACGLSVCVVFALLYWICYQRTAKTYYRIVKKMG